MCNTQETTTFNQEKCCSSGERYGHLSYDPKVQWCTNTTQQHHPLHRCHHGDFAKSSSSSWRGKEKQLARQWVDGKDWVMRSAYWRQDPVGGFINLLPWPREHHRAALLEIASPLGPHFWCTWECYILLGLAFPCISRSFMSKEDRSKSTKRRFRAQLTQFDSRTSRVLLISDPIHLLGHFFYFSAVVFPFLWSERIEAIT